MVIERPSPSGRPVDQRAAVARRYLIHGCSVGVDIWMGGPVTDIRPRPAVGSRRERTGQNALFSYGAFICLLDKITQEPQVFHPRPARWDAAQSSGLPTVR